MSTLTGALNGLMKLKALGLFKEMGKMIFSSTFLQSQHRDIKHWLKARKLNLKLLREIKAHRQVTSVLFSS